MPEIKLYGRTISYTIRYSKRARSASFKISMKRGFEVIVPEGEDFPQVEMHSIMLQRADWIMKHYTALEEVMQNAYKLSFVTGELLQVLDSGYFLDVIEDKTRRVEVWEDASNLKMRLPANLSPEERYKKAARAVEKWYRAKAEAYLIPRAHELAQETDLHFRSVRIGGLSTRWGSCNSMGDITLNWRLMMIWPNLVDYVIIHELCHLIELNHSVFFWELVAEKCPDYDLYEEDLRTTIPPL